MSERGPGILGKIRFVQDNNRPGSALGSQDKIPLDAARIDLRIKAVDNEHRIDVCGNYLFHSADAYGLA